MSEKLYGTISAQIREIERQDMQLLKKVIFIVARVGLLVFLLYLIGKV